MKRKRIISHMKEQDKTSEKQLNEKIGNLQIKKEKKKKKNLRIMILNMI